MVVKAPRFIRVWFIIFQWRSSMRKRENFWKISKKFLQRTMNQPHVILVCAGVDLRDNMCEAVGKQVRYVLRNELDI